MRIFYLCPDFSKPSGGIKRLYRHVEILRENSYDAYIMHINEGFKLHWFESPAPIVYTRDLAQLHSEDVLVLTEGLSTVMKQVKPLQFRKVVIALSFAYIFEHMPIGENWKDYGIHWVMASTKTIKDLVQWSMGIENVYIIKSSVDNIMFHYEPDVKKQQITYIKRKDTLSPIVEKILKARSACSDEPDFIAIENLKLQNYAQVLKQSQIYLTTSIHEGINLSVLEAMACGCVCIGFDGVGGREFIVESGEQQNFVRAENVNFIDLAMKLAGLMEMIKQKDPKVEKIRQNGLATAGRFTAELEKKSVLEFWRSFLESDLQLLI